MSDKCKEIIFSKYSCPGCDVELNDENVGGYRTFCVDCVSEMQSPPKEFIGPVSIQGKRGSFCWVEVKK